MHTVKIESSWKELLKNEFNALYFQQVSEQIRSEKANGSIIYPPGPLIFNAFNSCPFDKLKVVILGQDPYHGPGEAMGLCFSVPKGIHIPPSLLNIYKELKRSFGFEIPIHGDLSKWTREGVLLLNASLTVRHKMPNSHKNIGWEHFTDEVIRKISTHKNQIVFMLWGNFAKSKKPLIDSNKHLILESPHPSPLARGGFIGNSHFLLANNYLIDNNIQPIDWKIN
ncbi:MAG: uracil-DNA glycosylase [Saprospiraceae bacterium]|nr:uracil-DNA glycosylase [Saprospiraceae bacterium]MBK8484292.1 uracil-DNA glycosylase [Saprospiraceae bacterium]